MVKVTEQGKMMGGKYGDLIRIRFVSDIPNTGFVKGKVYDATFLKKDPHEKWYVIKDSSGEEYAYPRSWFEQVL